MLVALGAGALACGSRPGVADTQAPRPPLPPPQTDGRLAVEGISAPVQIIRDRWGIPHITAATRDDLFFAQGFVQAQDRLFQMDLWRRAGQGRLAEVLGANFIERDAMTRRVQYRGSIDLEWASYGPDARAIADAFTRGVNAWIATVAERPPEEFALAGWMPETWRPEDLLTRTETFLAGRGADDELIRARLAHAIGAPAAARYLPGADPHPSVDVDLAAISDRIGEMLRRVGAPPFFAGLSGPLTGPLRLKAPPSRVPSSSVRRVVDGGGAWSLAPARTSTGRAILASLVSTPLDHPSTRYLVHLKAPGWHVAGLTSPWRPGVIAGHNDRIAWSFVVAPVDTQHLIVERLNPRNSQERATPDGWTPFERTTAAVIVKGRSEPFESEQQFTPYGTVVALDRERHQAYVLAWPGREPGTSVELGALELGRATSWAQFTRALESWKAPVAEFVYADANGHIGRQTAGLVPARPASLPTAAWTRRRVWPGWVRARESTTFDPPEGRVLASPGHAGRRQRMETQLAPDGIGPDAVARVQRDVTSSNAETLVPLIGHMASGDPELETARRRLVSWDRQMRTGSVEAQLFVAWEEALLTGLAATRIPAALVPDVVPRAASALVEAIANPASAWFDTPTTRDRLLLDALAAAVAEMRRRENAGTGTPLPQSNLVLFAHPLGISSEASRRFDIGPLALAGSADAIAASGRNPANRTVGPTVRLIVDVGDWDRSRALIVPGQSAAPDSRHFADLVGRWTALEDVPLAFSDRAVAEVAESTLTLVPR